MNANPMDDTVAINAGPNCSDRRTELQEGGIRYVISKNSAVTTIKLIDDTVILNVRQVATVFSVTTL